MSTVAAGTLLLLWHVDPSLAMANVSPDLIWGVVKDTNCFLMKKKIAGRSGMGKAGAHFSKEPGNLKGVNSFKYSGIANAKTVGIAPGANNKGIVFTKKIGKADRARKVLLLACACLACMCLIW